MLPQRVQCLATDKTCDSKEHSGKLLKSVR